MKLLTAMDEGELRTFDVEIWAKKRNMPAKSILQRLRSDYTEDEAVNLPKYKQAACRQKRVSRFSQKYETDMSSPLDKLWLKFATGGMRHA